MAYQTGNIRYRGSFKSIRHWKNKHDPKIYAGEKGGANRDLIMNNKAFVRTRENMTEFEGCGMAVKAIRLGMNKLLPEHANTHFTGRVVAIVKMINEWDPWSERGKRGICFSQNKPLLKTLTFHEKKKIDRELKISITTSHPESRTEATLTIEGLNPNQLFRPSSAQYFRVINHLSIISDFAMDADGRVYESQSPLNKTSAYAYSDYTVVNTPLNIELKAAFPDGTLPGESDTVIQCVGIEYYIKSGADTYLSFSESTMLVYDVF